MGPTLLHEHLDTSRREDRLCAARRRQAVPTPPASIPIRFGVRARLRRLRRLIGPRTANA